MWTENDKIGLELKAIAFSTCLQTFVYQNKSATEKFQLFLSQSAEFLCYALRRSVVKNGVDVFILSLNFSLHEQLWQLKLSQVVENSFAFHLITSYYNSVHYVMIF